MNENIEIGETVEQIRSTGIGGATFVAYENGRIQPFNVCKGYLVSLLSVNLMTRKLNAARVEKIIRAHRKLAYSANIFVGLYGMGSRTSLDFNVIVQDRDLAEWLGKTNGQVAIWDCKAGKEIKTGGSGISVINSDDTAIAVAGDVAGH